MSETNAVPAASPSPEEMVATALNEQGFLLSQVVREKIQNQIPGDQDTQSAWKYVASEYPVTGTDGSQTRIDLVLRRPANVYLCLECKRPHPQFKRWVFFDKECSAYPKHTGRLAFEIFHVLSTSSTKGIESARHAIEPRQCCAPCDVFNSYLEASLKRGGGGGWKASHTDTIEDAFRQVIRGHTGFMAKLMLGTQPGILRSIPIVVTTAQLLEAQFDPHTVSLSTGMIEPKDLTLQPMDFCAVNYHADDSLALNSDYAGVLEPKIEIDMWFRQTRSIFIVHAEAINKFLTWLQFTFFSS
jgi:hypothetical protein